MGYVSKLTWQLMHICQNLPWLDRTSKNTQKDCKLHFPNFCQKNIPNPASPSWQLGKTFLEGIPHDHIRNISFPGWTVAWQAYVSIANLNPLLSKSLLQVYPLCNSSPAASWQLGKPCLEGNPHDHIRNISFPGSTVAWQAYVSIANLNQLLSKSLLRVYPLCKSSPALVGYLL